MSSSWMVALGLAFVSNGPIPRNTTPIRAMFLDLTSWERRLNDRLSQDDGPDEIIALLCTPYCNGHRVVEINDKACILNVCREVNPGALGPNGRVEGQVQTTAARAAADVVFLRRDIRHLIVEADHRRVQVVRQPGTSAFAG